MNNQLWTEFLELAEPTLTHEAVQQMKNYIQHGRVTTYEHCVQVAFLSFTFARRLRLRIDEESLVRGALLHDFYLYDWHVPDPQRKRFHGFHHAKTALKNAERHFALSPVERDIIKKHMWPMNLPLPRYRESVLVLVTDKTVSLLETFGWKSPTSKFPDDQKGEI